MLLFILEREVVRGEGEREKETWRNTDVRKKHQLAASCTHPNEGLNLQPRHVP